MLNMSLFSAFIFPKFFLQRPSYGLHLNKNTGEKLILGDIAKANSVAEKSLPNQESFGLGLRRKLSGIRTNPRRLEFKKK